MNKKLKQLIKKHVDIIKFTYPEVYIEIKMVGDDILFGIGSRDISKEDQYETLIDDFIEEYDREEFDNIFLAVNFSITKDDLHLLEDYVKTPKKVSIAYNKSLIAHR